MHILVIGSSGFIGRALTHRLVEDGHTIEGWSRSSEPARPGCVHRAIDLLAARELDPATGPWDGAVHLAGHSVPGADFDSSAVLDNLRMTAHALDHLARVQPSLRVVFASSAHVYRAGPLRKREDEEIHPENSYGLSKELCEAWACARDRDLRVIIVRLFNQIGPGMHEGLLIPDLMKSARTGTGPIVMRGADSTRDFLDVRDGALALARLLTADVPSGSVFNLCRGEGERVSTLARELVERLGVRREICFQDGSPPPLVGDPTKLARAIGWRPRYALTDTLDDIAAREAHGRRAPPGDGSRTSR